MEKFPAGATEFGSKHRKSVTENWIICQFSQYIDVVVSVMEDLGRTYLAVAFSSFGAIDPPSRMLPDKAAKDASPPGMLSLTRSASATGFGILLMLPRLEVVKDNKMKPATTMVMRMVRCRAIVGAKKWNAIWRQREQCDSLAVGRTAQTFGYQGAKS